MRVLGQELQGPCLVYFMHDSTEHKITIVDWIEDGRGSPIVLIDDHSNYFNWFNIRLIKPLKKAEI